MDDGYTLIKIPNRTDAVVVINIHTFDYKILKTDNLPGSYKEMAARLLESKHLEHTRVKEDNVKEKAYMDKGQAMEFLAYVRSEPMFEKLYCFSKLGLYYGLRRSELLGLRWDAIDFGKGEIAINHTVVRGEQGDIFRDNVKTKSSHRYLPLLESVKGDLLELMESQKELGAYSENGYVFTWEDGRVYSPDYMSKLFRKAVKRCGKVPEDLTLHGLRHSCCAILFEEGWELAKVQQWLGHSDISVTANIYNHVSKKWKNKHGEMVDGIFG